MKQQKSPGWLKQKMRLSSSFSISIEMVIISLHNTTSTTDHFLSINSSRLKRQRQIITKTDFYPPHNVIHFLVKLTLLPHIGDEYACGILSFLKSDFELPTLLLVVLLVYFQSPQISPQSVQSDGKLCIFCLGNFKLNKSSQV